MIFSSATPEDTSNVHERDDGDGGDGENQTLTTQPEEEHVYPQGLALVLIIASVLLSVFFVALDRTVLSVAIPKITDRFHSLDDVGWYGSSYLLTNCSSQLLFGRIYKFYNTKWVVVNCIVIFELGSALCGAAPSSVCFIIGRAIAGLGSAGIFAGGMMTIYYAVPLGKRPVYTGLFGATFGVASVIGPLIGGVLTDKLTWRWCFFLNLPIGGAALAIIVLILKLPDPTGEKLPLRQQLVQLDPLGTAVFLPSMVCLILALQWGGTTYAWSSWRMILLLTLFSVLIVIFAATQALKGDSGTLPPRILFQRSIAGGAYFTFCVSAGWLLIIQYLPIWFQAIKGTSALDAGIHFIPTVLALVLAGILGGKSTQAIGYYVPVMFLGPALASVGSGMLSTLKQNSGHAMWIGYQVIVGLGLGIGMQVSGLAAQAVLPQEDVSIGTAIMMFSQQLGGAIFVSVGQNVFFNDLISTLSDIPGLDTAIILNTGATDLQKTIPARYLTQVLAKYNHALTRTFIISTGMLAASILGSCFMEWKNIKTSKRPTGGPAARETVDLKKKKKKKKGETGDKEKAVQESKAETHVV